MTTRKSLSPIEIQSAAFRTVFRGFDREEVQLFLQAVAESYQALTLENQKLRTDIERMRASLDEFERREGVLRDALYTAQRVSDDVKAQALKEAQSIVQEAELKAESLIQQSQLRAHGLERTILDLKMERNDALAALQELTRRIGTLLEAIDEGRKRENVQAFGKDS